MAELPQVRLGGVGLKGRGKRNIEGSEVYSGRPSPSTAARGAGRPGSSECEPRRLRPSGARALFQTRTTWLFRRPSNGDRASVQFRPIMPSTVHIGGLPVEILERIFLELHYFDIRNVKLVSGTSVFTVANDPD